MKKISTTRPLTPLTGRRASLTIVTGVTLFFSASSFAQYEATATASSSTTDPIGHTTIPSDVSYTSTSYQPSLGSRESAVVTFTATPVASVRAEVSAFNPVGQIISSASGTIRYFFEVNAQPFTNVPVDFSGLYASSSSPAPAGYGSFTSFSIQTVNSSVSTYASFASNFYGDCGAPTCLQYNTHNSSYTSVQPDISHAQGSFAGSFDMLTGADGSVTGFVQLGAYASVNMFFVAKSAMAFIDPHLEIDSAFLSANPGTTLTITPGVGNAIAAVPEPGTYVLMLTGLVATAIGKRRGKKCCQRR